MRLIVTIMQMCVCVFTYVFGLNLHAQIEFHDRGIVLIWFAERQ